MIVFSLSGRSSAGAIAAQIEVKESEGKSADAEGHVKTAISGAAEVRSAAAAVGIITGVGVEVGGR